MCGLCIFENLDKLFFNMFGIIMIMHNCQFVLSRPHYSASKYYFDTLARFRVPQVMKNTLVKMADLLQFG